MGIATATVSSVAPLLFSLAISTHSLLAVDYH